MALMGNLSLRLFLEVLVKFSRTRWYSFIIFNEMLIISNNIILQMQSNFDDDEQVSFYSVFDGFTDQHDEDLE